MNMVRTRDLWMWRLCLLLAACCSAYAVAVGQAAAFPLADDVRVAAATLPADHPCRAGVMMRWTPGADMEDGYMTAAAAIGIRKPEGWLQRTVTGALEPLECVVRAEPTRWGRLDACERRRMLIHEFGHLAGLPHDEHGVMSPYLSEQAEIAVPSCPVEVESLEDRALGRVLELVPQGWEASCGDRHGRIVRCVAERGRRRRSYVVRVRRGHLVVQRMSSRR